jgi:hypothetical protein
MGIGKQGSPCRQFIKIGRFDLRMATQATNPVIEVIYSQKQNIGPGFGIDRCPPNKEYSKKD